MQWREATLELLVRWDVDRVSGVLRYTFDCERILRAHVAKYLVTQATLNKDQRGPVAFLANDMHEAWKAQGRPKRMRAVGRIARMLLVGGGGCGGGWGFLQIS